VRPKLSELGLLVALFLDMVGFTMLIPDVQLRAQSFLGDFSFKGPVIGFLLQITFIVQIIASPRWGRFADRTGRKRVFIVCQVLSALAMLVYSLATSIWVLLLSRFIAGLGAANVSTGQAIAASLAGEDRKPAVMGWISAALSGGMIFGPAVGGWLASDSVGGSRFIGVIGALISVLGAVLVLLCVKNDAHSETFQESDQASGRKIFDLSLLSTFPSVRPLFLISISASFALATLEGTFGRLIKQLLGMGPREFGIVFSYEAVLGVFISAFGLAWLSRKLCETSLLRFGYVLQGVGLAINPLAGVLSAHLPGLFWLFVASTFYAVGVGVVNPTLNTLSSNSVPEQSQGELFGLMQSARTTGFVIGPILGGALFDIWFAAPYVLASLVCIFVAVALPAICKCHPILNKSQAT
jgi:MFS transporter, DHA1 family, multidrug resistance protein